MSSETVASRTGVEHLSARASSTGIEITCAVLLLSAQYFEQGLRCACSRQLFAHFVCFC